MTVDVQNNSKYFILNRSDLDGRIDPQQFHFERRIAIEKLKQNNELLKLKDVVKNVKTITKQITEFDKYIGLENIESNTGQYIPSAEKLSISSAGVFKKGQILFPKLRPYLNKVYLTEFDGICSTEFHIYETQKINNEFLAIYLRSDLIVNQTKHLMTGNTLPRLQTEDINNLPVPNISNEAQKKIVAIYNKAYSQKQQKEAQAKKLLQSIDTYILETLDITIPAIKKGIEHRMFITNFSDVVGSRIDPKLYDSTTKELKEAIANTSFTKIELKKLLVQSIAGDWGKDENEVDLINIEDYTKCLVIRATEFENEGNLTLDNSRVKYRLILNSKLKKIDIQENDLLIEKSGGSIDQPVGRIALITQEHIENNVLCYSNFIHKIRVDNIQINPFYLFYFLKAIHNLKLTDAMQSQTNGIRNLIMSNYFNQIIPIPSKVIQSEIVKHIDELHNQINKLKADAIAVLEDAKAEVEKIIIG